MMLCVFAGTAWAGPTDLPEITTDLENPIYYTIYNTRSTQPGGLMYYAGDGVGMKDGCTSPTLEDKYKFYFTGSHDALYVHNAATTKKLASVSSWSDEGIEWAVGVSPKGGGLAFGPKGGLNGNGCWNEKNYSTDANTSDFTTWSANDDGSIFVVELASEYTFPETDKFYTIECPLFESVQNVKKGLYVTAEGALAWGTVDLTNKNHYWVPTVNVDNTVVLKNLGTGKYLNGTEMADAEVNATLNALSSTQFNIKVNGTTVHANGHNSGNGAGSGIVSWGGAANSASAWTFVEQADPDAAKPVTIKYSFTYNGEVKYTQETNTLVGQEYPTITTTFPFGVSAAAKPEGTIPNEGIDEEGVKTVEIALSVNLPFVPAADYESVSNWYYLIFHANNKNPLYYDGTENVLDASKTAVDANNREAYAWSFVGNPFDGFKVVNKLAGSTRFLNAVSDGAVVSEGTDNVFMLTASTYGTNGFFMQCTTGSNTQRFNKQNNKVVYWSGADAGSTFMVEVCDFTGATELQALIDQVKAAQENYVAGTTVGYLTQASVNAVAQAVTDAETYLASGSVTAEGSAEHQTAIDNAIGALETVQPEEGKFYTIQNAYSSVYMGVSNTTGMVTSATEGFGQVFQFVPASEGTFYLFNVERGAYLNTAKHHGYGQNSAGVDIAEAKSVTIANLGKENRVSITPQGGATLHHDANLATVVGWTGDANSRSAWKIVEVEDMSALSHSVTITDAGWATLVLGCNTAIPADVKAYAVSAVGDGYATLTEVTGTIPSNEAVLLNAVAGTYEFKYAAESTPVENELVGTVFNTNVTDKAYVLSKQNDVVGFYKANFNVSTDTTNDGTTEEPAVTYEAFLNNAFKAYLPATTAESRFLVFNFGDDNATAIEGIEAENTADAVVYDLAGRRVQKAQKGLYIVNGKKVIK